MTSVASSALWATSASKAPCGDALMRHARRHDYAHHRGGRAQRYLVLPPITNGSPRSQGRRRKPKNTTAPTAVLRVRLDPGAACTGSHSGGSKRQLRPPRGPAAAPRPAACSNRLIRCQACECRHVCPRPSTRATQEERVHECCPPYTHSATGCFCVPSRCVVCETKVTF